MSNIKYFGSSDLLYLLNLLKTEYEKYVLAVPGKGLSTNDFTNDLLTKLNGIASGAEVNQDAFGNVKVGATTITAGSKTDTIEFEAGSNVTLTPDASNEKVTIAVPTTDTYSSAGTSPVDGKAIAAAIATLTANSAGGSGKYIKGISEANGIISPTEGTIDSAVTQSSDNPVSSGGVYTKLQDYAPLASPALTGVPTAPTAAAGTNTTQIATTAFTTGAIADALATITGISFESYTTSEDLPAVGQTGVIYLVPNSGLSPNVNDEYFWNTTTQAYELFGTTQVDLTDYVKFENLVELTQAEVLAAWNSVFGS